MKRKLLASLLVVAMGASLLTGCGSKPESTDGAASTDGAGSEAAASTETSASSDKVINLWAFTDEVPGMIEKYKEAHPI